MKNIIARHGSELSAALHAGNYKTDDQGGLILLDGVRAQGFYTHSVNGQDLREDPNLIVDQGLIHMLDVAFGATAKLSNWYLALYAGAISPAANWTAASFAATASEITSGSEGYSNATRPVFTAGAAAANEINNLATKASFTIVTASVLNVNGAALLSNSAKGSTAGVLASATRYAATRALYNGDVFEQGYRVVLTST